MLPEYFKVGDRMLKKNNIKNVFYFLTIVVIIFCPKINLINIPNTSTGIRIDDFLIAISFLLCIFTNKNIKFKNKIYINSALNYFYIYIFICFLSTIIGYFHGTISILLGLVFCFRKIEYFIFIFIGFDYFQSSIKLMKLINFSVVFHFIIVLLQKFKVLGSFAQTSIGVVMEGRYSSIFTGSYELTAFLLLLLPFYLVDNNNNSSNNSNALMTTLIFLILMLSESRSSLVLFMFISCIIYFKKNKKTKSSVVRLMMLFNLFALLHIIFGSTLNVLPRLEDLSLNNIKNAINYSWTHKSIFNYLHNYNLLTYYPIGDLSFNIRIKNWMCLIDGILQNPIFGMGMSIVKNASDGGYIRMLAECGIFGLVSWLLFLKKIYLNLKKSNNFLSKCMIYSLISVMIGAIFIDLFDASKVMCMFWFLIGFSFKGGNINEKNSSI